MGGPGSKNIFLSFDIDLRNSDDQILVACFYDTCSYEHKIPHGIQENSVMSLGLNPRNEKPLL